MFPRMCAYDEMSYPELLGRLVSLGIERAAERKALRYTYQ
jgi:hypothetical protein